MASYKRGWELFIIGDELFSDSALSVRNKCVGIMATEYLSSAGSISIVCVTQ